MKPYSENLKSRLIARMLPPNNVSISALIALDPAEQFNKTLRAVIDVEFLQQLPRGQPHGDAA